MKEFFEFIFAQAEYKLNLINNEGQPGNILCTNLNNLRKK